MVKTIWNGIPQHYHGIKTDEFVVMPNHFHGATVIVGAGPCACPIMAANGHPKKKGNHGGLPLRENINHVDNNAWFNLEKHEEKI